MSKSTPQTQPDNFPLAGLARDGWSTSTEATATCFCGAVQLQFVSAAALHFNSLSCTSRKPCTLLMLAPAHASSRPCEYLRLPLCRLPQDHSQHVCIQLHGAGRVSCACERKREFENLGTGEDDWQGARHDKSVHICSSVCFRTFIAPLVFVARIILPDGREKSGDMS